MHEPGLVSRAPNKWLQGSLLQSGRALHPGATCLVGRLHRHGPALPVPALISSARATERRPARLVGQGGALHMRVRAVWGRPRGACPAGDTPQRWISVAAPFRNGCIL